MEIIHSLNLENIQVLIQLLSNLEKSNKQASQNKPMKIQYIIIIKKA